MNILQLLGCLGILVIACYFGGRYLRHWYLRRVLWPRRAKETALAVAPHVTTGMIDTSAIKTGEVTTEAIRQFMNEMYGPPPAP